MQQVQQKVASCGCGVGECLARMPLRGDRANLPRNTGFQLTAPAGARKIAGFLTNAFLTY